MCSYGLVLVLLLITPIECTSARDPGCLPWEKLAKDSCECRHSLLSEMKCRDGILYLDINRCMTYDNSTLYEASCPYIKSPHQIDHNSSSVRVPTNLSQITSFFCDPLNRKGLVCGECKEGYGVSLLTVGLKCSACTHPWKGWLLYLTTQFLPITIFYVLIFALQISVTSIPMNCFVLYSQIIVGTFNCDEVVLNEIYVQATPFFQAVFKMLLTLYEPWNLDFFTYLIPEFCISPSIKGIHISILRYIPAVYFFILITITYFILKLNNYRCQVPLIQRLSQPFKSCMGAVRTTWNPQASAIDVIGTLFLLSFNKIVLNSLLLFRYSHIKDVSTNPPLMLSKNLHIDPTVKYLGAYHVCYTIPAMLVLSFMCTMLLLLTCYPFGFFRKALACLVRSTMLQWIHVFVEKLQGHYKDGTSGTYDMRLFSVHYLVLRVVLILISPVVHVPSTIMYLVRGFVLIISSILVLIARPYKKESLSAYDGLLLGLLGIQAILVNVQVYFLKSSTYTTLITSLLAITLALPQLVLIIYIANKMFLLVAGKCKSASHHDVAVLDDFFNGEQRERLSGSRSASIAEKRYLLAPSKLES